MADRDRRRIKLSAFNDDELLEIMNAIDTDVEKDFDSDDDVRYDNIGHFPIWLDKESKRWFKLCKKITNPVCLL